MNTHEATFRLVAASILVAVAMTRDTVRIWIYLRSRPRRTPWEILSEFIRNNRDASIGSVGMAILAGACLVSIGLYIFAPDQISWSQVPIPDWSRWIGAAIGWLGAFGEMWAFIYLGQQYSALLRVRTDHRLIEGGPYRWVRHPMYSFMLPFLVGIGLLAANWFISLTALIAMTLAMVQRVPKEETMLIKAFGDSYKTYARRTGRLFPRLRADLET